MERALNWIRQPPPWSLLALYFIAGVFIGVAGYAIAKSWQMQSEGIFSWPALCGTTVSACI